MGASGGLVELEVTKVAHGGVGVARLDGRVVFVTGAIPGERVVALVVDASRDRFWRAATVEVLDASPHRRVHVWPEGSLDRAPGERAGGADFGHISLDHQRELKRQVLTEALGRFASVPAGAAGGASAEVAADVATEGAAAGLWVEPVCDGAGWRTRARLHVGEDGVPGPFAERSHTVVPVTGLPLAVPALQEVAPLAARFEPGSAIDLVAPSVGDPLVIVTEPAHRGRDRGRGRGRGRARGSSGRPRPRLWSAGAVGAEPGTVTERVGEREFRLDAAGFWQVHYRAAETLSAAVTGMIDADRFDPGAENLDLYGGVGLLAAAIADVGGPATRVTTVESSPGATAHASANLASISGADAVTARVEVFLRGGAAGSAPGATVVLDPPRSGAGREVVDLIAERTPAQVVYVACDPVAFARDVGYFAERGWRLASLRAFDLFPHTHHVESIGLLLPDWSPDG